MIEIGRHLGSLEFYSHLNKDDRETLVETLEGLLFEGPVGCLPALAELFDPRVHKKNEMMYNTITRIAELPNSLTTKEVIGQVIVAGIAKSSKAEALDLVNKGLLIAGHDETEVWMFAEFATEMMMIRKKAANR